MPTNNSGKLGVNFIKVGRTVQIIEIALSIFTLRLRPTFEKLFTCVKVGRRAQKIGVGCKTFYEMDLRLLSEGAKNDFKDFLDQFEN